MAPIVVRDATPDDMAAVADIQNALLATSGVEWTDEPHTVDERLAWLERQQTDGFPVVVADAACGGSPAEVVGWAAYGWFRDAHKWPGYRFTAELTIHVRDDLRGTGVGRRLMEALVDRAVAAGVHVLVAAIDGENDGSVRFHERLDFVEVGRMPEVGAKLGCWRELVLLQRVLDARDRPPT